MVEVVDFTQLGSAGRGQTQRKGTRRDRNLFMGAKVLSLNERDEKTRAATAASSSSKCDGDDSDDELKMEVKTTLRKIDQMAASAMTDKERRKHETQQAISLGMRPAKNIKIPLKIVQGMRKKQKERVVTQREAQREQGMLVKRGATTEDKLKEKLSAMKRKQRWTDKSDVNGDRISKVGTYGKNGILHISKQFQGRGGTKATQQQRSKTARISRLHKAPSKGEAGVGQAAALTKPSGRVPRGTRR